MDSKRDVEPGVRNEVARRLTHPITLAGGAILALEFLIAMVVIFSRMSAGFQFLCVLLMSVPMLAIVAVALRAIAPASPARTELPRASLPPLQVSEADHEAMNLVTRLEELADNTRRFPLNVTTGFDEEQFTYTTVKLRGALQSLLASQPEQSPAVRALPPQPQTIDQPTSQLRADPEIQDSIDHSLAADAAASPVSDNGGEAMDDKPSAEEPADVMPPEPVLEAAATDSPECELEESEEAQPVEPAEDNAVPLAETISAARDALRKRDSDEAIRLLSSLGSAAEASELLGIAYELAGNRPAALDSLRVAIQTDSHRASAHFNYAVILAKEERLDEATREAEIALDLKPDYTAARELVLSLSDPREVRLG